MRRLEPCAFLLLCAVLFGPTGAVGQSLRIDLRIGVVDGDESYMFHNIQSIDVTRSGELLIFDGGSSQIRRYDASGRFLHAFGRSGRGPGEWRDPLLVRLGGNEIMVLEAARVQLFDLQGNLLRSFPTTAPGEPFIAPLAWTPAGWLASVRPLVDRDRTAVAGQFYTDSVSVQLIDSLGKPTRLLVRYPLPRMVGMPGGGSGEFSRYWPLFEGRPAVAFDAAGRTYVTDREAYRIQVYDPAGRPVRAITRDHRPVRITQSHLDSYTRRVREFYRQRQVPDADVQMRRTIDDRLASPRPDLLPALGRLLVADDSAVWVERADVFEDPGEAEFRRTFGGRDEPPPPSTWDRFDGSGQFLGTVQLPAKFSPHRVTHDTVLGVQPDENDVEFVVRYRVVR